MEFASEMIIKAALLEQGRRSPGDPRPDLRGRPPHLRPWRDGWRHLRYLLMLSPFWLFGLPSAIFIAASAALLTTMAVAVLTGHQITRFGNYWAVLAGSLLTLGHMGLILALAGQLYGIGERYRRPPTWLAPLAAWFTLELMLLSGLASMLVGLVILVAVVAHLDGARFAAHWQRPSGCAWHQRAGDRHAERPWRVSAGDRERQ